MHIISKRKDRNTAVLLLNGTGSLDNAENMEVRSACFASVLSLLPDSRLVTEFGKERYYLWQRKMDLGLLREAGHTQVLGSRQDIAEGAEGAGQHHCKPGLFQFESSW